MRAIGAGERELLLETWQGRFKVLEGGKLAPAEAAGLRRHNPLRSFQIAWSGTRATDRDDWPWGSRDTTPLQAAVYGGARLPDGSALGVVQSTVSRVDLATGQSISLSTDWIPSGLDCQLLPDGDGVLFACTWERYQGYGGYVLRATGEGSPVIERAFTDEGSFVADDEGALGYAGSCRAVPRLFDPEEANRYEYEQAPAIKPTFCVRRRAAPGSPARPAEWIERSVELAPGATLVAWVPRRDGSAVALVLGNDPLPENERSALRVSEQGGVRVVRLYRELEGWGWGRPSWQPSLRGTASSIDRRFHARADGSIDGWVAPGRDNYASVLLGVTLDPEGRPLLHDLPPSMVSMTVTGDYGLAISRKGELFETTDHGRSWTPAGLSPVPPSQFTTGGCSALGCTLGPVVRLGWGEGALVPQVSTEPISPPENKPSAPRLACAPMGTPVPLPLPPAAPPGTKQTFSTGYGDTLELVRDLAAPDLAGAPIVPPGNYRPPARPSLPSAHRARRPSVSASAKAPPAKSVKAAPTVLRTHTLVYRPPFEPMAPSRRLNATDAAFNVQRRTIATPLLAPGGEIGLLLAGDSSELLVRGDKIQSSPAFEPRRYYYGDTSLTGGLLLPSGHAIALGELRRRPTLEEHGATPPLPPLFVGVEREQTRRRPMTLGRRDDGAVGILIFDGGAPETVGVAEVDRTGGSVLPVTKLAPWSSLVTAGDPRCKADAGDYRALVLLDPTTWFELDSAALPGVSLAKQGMALVRWGKERVCLEAIDVGATEGRRRGDSSRSFSVVVRWGGGEKGGKGAAGKGNGALRALDLRQELFCSVQGSPLRGAHDVHRFIRD